MQRRGLNVRKVLLGTVLPLLRRLPPRLASNLIAGIGRTEYSLFKGLRHRVDQAVLHGSHHFGRNWDVPTVGRALAGNQIRWRTRDRLLDGLADEHVAPLFAVSGRERLDAVLRDKAGVVLLCNHFGSHMMPAHWLLRENYPLRLFMERPRHVSKFLARQFDTEGPTGQRKLFISRRAAPAEAASSILRAARVLKDGMILMIAGDVRWSGPQNSPAVFLGRHYTFSNTWVRLAAMTGAAVVPVFCRIDDGGAYHLTFQEPYWIPRDCTHPDEVAAWVQEFLKTIEAQVERYPANSNEYLFWDETSATTPAARSDV
ncbi:MAG: lysophospholipid acyltransferase family protein [Planctomycetia bacterium]|nr:lysophospholipid acyltransferase family protein [Planctomycetia bacterium]